MSKYQRPIRNAFLLLTALLAGGMAFSEIVAKSIALVNGDAIYLSEFESNWESLLEQREQMTPGAEIPEEWKKEQKNLLLNQMIEEKLLLQEAKKENIKVPRRQLEEGIRQVQNRFKIVAPGQKPTKEDFERPLSKEEKKEFLAELEKQGLTEKEFELRIEDQLRIVRLTEEEIRGKLPSPFKDASADAAPEDRELTDAYEKEAKNLFASIKAKFDDKKFNPSPDDELDQMVELLKSRLGESVRASHILIRSSRKDDFKTRSAALAKVKAILAEIKAGADFETVAKTKSEGPSAPKGGDLGYFSRGQMVKEFDDVAFSLGVGEVSDVVETEFGYHIIKVFEKKAARPLRYDDIKIDLAGYLFQKKGQERYDEYLAKLRDKADIKITINLDSQGG